MNYHSGSATVSVAVISAIILFASGTLALPQTNLNSIQLRGYVISSNSAPPAFVDYAVIPTNRLTNWTLAGVPGGVPEVGSANYRTTIWSNIAAGASAATINGALASCPSNEVVKLGSGTFTVSAEIQIQTSYVTLRGSTNTYIVYNGVNNNYDAIVELSTNGSGSYYTASDNCDPYTGASCGTPGYTVNNSVNILAGAKQGSTSLTITNTAGLKVGQVLGVDQLADDSSNVWSYGCRLPYDGTNSVWANRGAGARVLQQYVLVTAINNATNITISPALYSPFWSQALTPQVFWQVNQDVQYSSIEDLDVNAASLNGSCVDTVGAYACWVRNVTMHNPSTIHMQTLFTKNCEFRHCTFTDFPAGNSGAYGFQPVSSSDLRFEDNLFTNYFNAVNFVALSGSVFAYNYFTNDLANVSNVGNPTFNFFPHVGHSHFNLVEGNYARSQTFDCLYGNSSYNATFRNRLTGPEGTNNGWAERIMVRTYDFSAVGNILGSTNWGMDYEGLSGNDIWCYASNTNPASPGQWYDTRDIDPLVTNTMFRAGNWDATNNAVIWLNASSQTISNSLAYASKPTWWGSSRPWPPFDPNRSSSAFPTNLPAGYRFVNGGTDPP